MTVLFVRLNFGSELFIAIVDDVTLHHQHETTHSRRSSQLLLLSSSSLVLLPCHAPSFVCMPCAGEREKGKNERMSLFPKSESGSAARLSFPLFSMFRLPLPGPEISTCLPRNRPVVASRSRQYGPNGRTNDRTEPRAETSQPANRLNDRLTDRPTSDLFLCAPVCVCVFAPLSTSVLPLAKGARNGIGAK